MDELSQMQQQMKEVTVEDNVVEVEDGRQMKFSVTNPIKVGKHIKYTVTGVDPMGDFQADRRYSEFFALRGCLSHRWPGIYIPAIPEKKVMGNKEDSFIEERR